MLKETLLHHMPASLLGFFARSYIGGYSLQAALECARDLYEKKKILSTIDLLGEEVHEKAKALYNKDLYLNILEEIEKKFSSPKPSVSLKLSSITENKNFPDRVEVDETLLRQNLQEILDKAKKYGIDLTIDMEDFRWTDLTLKIYKEFFEKGNHHVGTVLQTRLFRNEKDIEELPPSCRVRLCIGIYQESSQRALTDKEKMKDLLVSQGKKLLEKGVYTEFATHDEKFIARVFDEVILPGGYKTNQFEVQMLLGVPREALQSDLASGKFRPAIGEVKVRLYVPFAENKKDAAAYCKRRLVHNPAMLSYGVKNLFGKIFSSRKRT